MTPALLVVRMTEMTDGMNYQRTEIFAAGTAIPSMLERRWWRAGIVVIVGVVLGIAGLRERSAAAEEPVSAEIVSVVPRASDVNRSLFVGLRFTIVPGWHLYWKNPGESGLPTKVAWELPPGFVAESLQWPRPLRFSPPGQPAMFGYEGEVLLISRVVPPADYRWGDPIEVTARTSWLGCSPKSCVRGAKELREQLSPDRSKSPAYFEDWLRRVPLPASRHPAVRGLGPIGDAGVEVFWGEAVSEVEVLPELPLAQNGWRVAISSESRGDRRGVTAVLATPGEGADPRPIPVLVLFRRADGSSDGITVSVPLRGEEASRGVVPGGTPAYSPSQHHG